jgi:hypothetical protein
MQSCLLPKGYYESSIRKENLGKLESFLRQVIPSFIQENESLHVPSPTRLSRQKLLNQLSKMMFKSYHDHVHIFTDQDDVLVGVGTLDLSPRHRGQNSMSVLLHPDHAQKLSHYFLSSLVNKCYADQPNKTIMMTLGNWQQQELLAAKELGFKITAEVDQLELKLSN